METQTSVHTASAPATASVGDGTSLSVPPRATTASRVTSSRPWPGGVARATSTPVMAQARAKLRATLLPSPTQATRWPSRCPPQWARNVIRSAMACRGWLRSDRRLTTGTLDTATMRSSTPWSRTRAPMAAWYWARVRTTSSALSRESMPTSSPRIVTGCPPSWKTAISDELRVRADGFWNNRATPRPARTRGGFSSRARSSTRASRPAGTRGSPAARSSTSRMCLVMPMLPPGRGPGCRRPRLSPLR